MQSSLRNTKRTLVNLGGILLVVAVLALLNETGQIDRYAYGIIVQCCFTIILVASLNIATGFLGQIALGHAGFMAIGAYTSALVTKAFQSAGILADAPVALFFVGLACGAVMAALFGILVGIPALRLRGDYLAIITLGFGEIIRVVIQNLPFAGGRGLSQGQAGQALIGIMSMNNIYIIFGIMALCMAAMFRFVRSKYGRALAAIREDDIASSAVGLNNTFYRVAAFTIAAFFAGIGGAIFAHRGLGTLQPSDFSFLKSTEYIIMVVLGGMGSLTGSVIAAIVLSILPEMLRAFAQYRMLVYAVVLVLMMIFRPAGLFGSYEFSLYHFPARVRAYLAKRKQKGKEADK
ncbi:MAG: branched-chain amino acid ABC transporter permease [Christensenellales bacterium]|jgi:branched-chain amino acid transport system permease protein